MSYLNQILGGLAGGFTGLGQQREQDFTKKRLGLQDARQARLDQYGVEDRAKAQDAERTLGQYLKPALMGDQDAQAQVIRVAPHLADRFVKPPTPDEIQYDADRGGRVNVTKNTFEQTPGIAPKPKTPLPGSPEWRQELIDKAKIEKEYGYHAPQTDTHYQIIKDDATGKYSRVKVEGPEGPLEETFTRPGGGVNSGSQAPIGDLTQRYQEIKQHAEDLAAGKWQLTSAMQNREGLTYGIARESAKGNPPFGKQVLAGALDFAGGNLGVGADPNSPDFQRFQALMNSQRAFGDDAAKVFKGRQNEESVLREIASNQLTPDDYKNPAVVQQKLDRMQHIIDLANAVMPGGTGVPHGGQNAPAPVHGAGPRADMVTPVTAAQKRRAATDPEYAAFLRSQGKIP